MKWNWLFNSNINNNIVSGGLLFLRLFAGFLLLRHGWAKLINFANISESFFDPIGIGGSAALSLIIFAELFCSIGIMRGLLTRWACIPILIGLSVAAFGFHTGATLQEIELPILYLVCFTTIMITGPGKYSIDNFIKKFLLK